MRILSLVLLSLCSLFGQASSSTASRIVRGFGAPSTGCSTLSDVGKVYIQLDKKASGTPLYSCSQSGNGTFGWVSSGTATGGTGTVTSVGLTGTANQITITGSSPITTAGSFAVSIPTNPTLPGNTTGTFIGSLTGTASGNLTASNSATLTNKTFDTAGTGNSFSINGTAITAVSGTGAVCLASGSSCGGGGGGVTSLTGTANQITASASTGAVTLSVPSNPVFSGTVSAGGFSAGTSPPAVTGTGVIACGESTGQTGAASGVDVFICDSATHNVLLSKNNGTLFPVTQTVCSGTIALGTSAIASGAKDSTKTLSCTGAASTDIVRCSANADISGVTGYVPSASGTLGILPPFATTNTLNVIVENNTGGSITPGAVTLNCGVWR